MTGQKNYYDTYFAQLRAEGAPHETAVLAAADAYLDGRPQQRGRKPVTRKERDREFWSSAAVSSCPATTWHTDAMVLALTRYMSQEAVAAESVLRQAAQAAPAALIRAVRYSGLVLNQSSPRRTELDRVATGSPELTELCRVLDIFDQAHRERVAAVETWKAALSHLSAFELLIYASVYAFKHLVPAALAQVQSHRDFNARHRTAWDAINTLLAWKLAGQPVNTLHLDDEEIGRSIARHLRPLLFAEDRGAVEASRMLETFEILMDAQIELDEFVRRSAEAFSYDDSIRFERHDDRLEIVEVDPALRAAWWHDGRKLDRLHIYWLYRAVDEFAASDVATKRLGRPENEEANRQAWVFALRNKLRLNAAYGIADEVPIGNGQRVDLFGALLSLELMSAHFRQDFLAAFGGWLAVRGDWTSALRDLALDGLRNDLANRLPLTWSARDVKVANITGWTVTQHEPEGSPRMAAAILDFWTYDMVDLAHRIQRGGPGLQPEFLERPVLKFGSTLVQLPWVVGIQNNGTAAINNLRRLGARRTESRDETRRIEAAVASALQSRGFKVVLNWTPPKEAEDAGEVDVMAARDGHLVVMEVKSTYLRSSQRDAWRHATTTLRKAGRQLHRKVRAVSLALETDVELRTALGLEETPGDGFLHGWIVDTSIEGDHQRFSGFLKVSLEELLIALRDDAQLLRDPGGLLTGQEAPAPISDDLTSTLYPDGFSALRFVEVIETEAVWSGIDPRGSAPCNVASGLDGAHTATGN